MATPPAQPWPQPRLVLAGVVHDPDRALVTFTVTNAKTDGTATLDTGDGRTFPITITGAPAGTGTLDVRYADPGHHTYTPSVTSPAPQQFATWTDLAASVDLWSDAPLWFETWQDATRTSESASTSITVDVGEATLDAVLVDAIPLPYVQINAWIGDPETVTSWSIEREAPGAGGDANVIVWVGTAGTAGISVIDREAPLEVPVRYKLILHRGNVSTVFYSPWITITGTIGCYLTDTSSGLTIPAQVQAWPERARAPRQAVLEVINRSDPIVISDVHTTPTGTWTFLTRTKDELDALYNVLLPGRLVLLRTQPASSLRTTYAAVGRITERRLYPGRGDRWERLTDVEIQEIAPIPATARILHVTWQTVADTWLTWAQVPAAMPTWLDLSQWNPDITPVGASA
jgi:hypothetical protein